MFYVTNTEIITLSSTCENKNKTTTTTRLMIRGLSVCAFICKIANVAHQLRAYDIVFATLGTISIQHSRFMHIRYFGHDLHITGRNKTGSYSKHNWYFAYAPLTLVAKKIFQVFSLENRSYHRSTM